MVAGVEAQVSLCVDMLFPVTALVDLCRQFRDDCPSVDPRADPHTRTGVIPPTHPRANPRGPISTARLRDSIQLVLSELHGEGHPDQAVLSSRTWRVRDLHTKHALLRAGLGWGNLPEHLVRDDLRSRRLLKIRVEAWGEDEHTLYLSAVYRGDVTFGPAHRWLLAHLEHLCLRDDPPRKPPPPRRRSRG